MTKHARLLLIDLLRTYSFFTIYVFHLYTSIFSTDISGEKKVGYLFGNFEFFRFGSFSGFTIVVIFCFLSAWNGSKIKFSNLFFLFFAGVFLLTMTQGPAPFEEVFLEWDIYHYLVFVLISLLFLRRFPQFVYLLGLLGIVMTWIPFWKYFDNPSVPDLLRHILTGLCNGDGRGGWPLLPWIGISWTSYAFGKFCRDYSFRFWELSLLPIALFFSFSAIGYYGHAPLDIEFSCSVFRQIGFVYWSHMFWIYFLCRMGTEPKVNQFLEKKWLLWLSHLEINRHFGRAYFIHLFYIALASTQAEDLQKYPILLDLVFLTIPFLTEFTLRTIKSGLRLYNEGIEN